MAEKKSNTKNNLKALPPKEAVEPVTLNRLQLTLTLISVVSAVVSTIFAIFSYNNSLPKVKLESWEFADYITGKNNFEVVILTVNVSNTGGDPISLVKPDVSISYKKYSSDNPKEAEGERRIVGEFPGVSDAEANAIIDVLMQTGTVEFKDEASNKICFGTNCYVMPKPGVPTTFAFLGNAESLAEEISNNREPLTDDDTPIYIHPGETRTITIAWYIPDIVRYGFSEIESINMMLLFNNGQALNFILIDNLTATR